MVNFKFLSFSALFSFARLACGQTAPGFPVSVSASLNVTFGTNNVNPAGELIPRPDTANPPNISTPVFTSAGSAVLFLIDSDVPSNTTRTTLLHWLVDNVTLATNGSSSGPLRLGNAIASYAQPSPGVGDIPHAYSFVLFPRPSNFSIPSSFNDVIQSRRGFNITQFIAATGLQAPLAGNYITVQNLTGVTATATTYPPARPTSSPTTNATRSVTPFPGAAPVAMVDSRIFWAGVASFALAGVAAFAL